MCSAVYDTNANKSVVFWKDSIDSDALYACTITLASDDAQTHGTITNIIDNNFSNKSWSDVYDSNAKKVIVTYASTQTGTATSNVVFHTDDEPGWQFNHFAVFKEALSAADMERVRQTLPT